MSSGVGPLVSQSQCDARPLGVMEQLVCKREIALDQLAEIDKSIEVFKQHPEVELALSHRVGIYR